MRNLVVAGLIVAAGPAAATGIEIDVAGEGANGTIAIDLFEDVAPEHVERITTLAQDGAYDNVVFHRVIDGFMAQTGDVEFGKAGGDMRMAGRGGSDKPDLPAEFSDRSFETGTVGMARSQSPDSANSQFFIMLAPAPHLDGSYTVVGEVTGGQDVVDAIKRGTGQNGAIVGQPDVMEAVRVTE
ncbi:peptidyl-prolyl cis-trans isomerase [Roseivivax halodurans JCM 10272]|uniref:Peptidyl-prolyl cis-trans isomerase n=1 Tax=Roseivivax halodurans JCM 10272 TaxID=1449350 RepID=X7EEJ4_9RHOB|nr:peptidylprolyl isomerase [Roseivivax halodurans]ETX14499.1 peptidyl-prolyl cis-trans isomerase [Roseivivax halodurans JCM 10272]